MLLIAGSSGADHHVMCIWMVGAEKAGRPYQHFLAFAMPLDTADDANKRGLRRESLAKFLDVKVDLP